jgi:hypothetical protein
MSKPDMKLGTLDALPVGLLVLGIGSRPGGTTGYAINPPGISDQDHARPPAHETQGKQRLEFPGYALNQTDRLVDFWLVSYSN